MPVILAFLLIVPVVAALVALRAPASAGAGVTAVSGAACFAAVIALVPAAAQHDVTLGSYLRADALSVVFLLATGFLYAAVGVYLTGYLQPSPGTPASSGQARRARRLLAGVNIFAASMLAAPIM